MDEVAGSQILQLAKVLKEDYVGVSEQHLSKTQTLLCFRGSDLKIAVWACQQGCISTGSCPYFDSDISFLCLWTSSWNIFYWWHLAYGVMFSSCRVFSKWQNLAVILFFSTNNWLVDRPCIYFYLHLLLLLWSLHLISNRVSAEKLESFLCLLTLSALIITHQSVQANLVILMPFIQIKWKDKQTKSG